MHNRRSAGFTLIEIMVVLAIVAILATIALPIFADQMRKSRRAEAVSAMQDVQLRLERHRVDNPNFVNGAITLADTNWYDFTITAAADTPNAYSITATALGDQVKDKCGNLSISVNAGVTTKTPADIGCW